MIRTYILLLVILDAVDAKKYMLLDDRNVISAERSSFVLGTVKKHSNEALIKEDKEWEMRCDKLIVLFFVALRLTWQV